MQFQSPTLKRKERNYKDLYFTFISESPTSKKNKKKERKQKERKKTFLFYLSFL